MSRARANPKYYRPDGGESLWPARRYPSHPHAPDPAWRVTRTRSGAGPLQRSPTRPATPIATGSGSGPFWDSHRSGPVVPDPSVLPQPSSRFRIPHPYPAVVVARPCSLFQRRRTTTVRRHPLWVGGLGIGQGRHAARSHTSHPIGGPATAIRVAPRLVRRNSLPMSCLGSRYPVPVSSRCSHIHLVCACMRGTVVLRSAAPVPYCLDTVTIHDERGRVKKRTTLSAASVNHSGRPLGFVPLVFFSFSWAVLASGHGGAHLSMGARHGRSPVSPAGREIESQSITRINATRPFIHYSSYYPTSILMKRSLEQESAAGAPRKRGIPLRHLHVHSMLLLPHFSHRETFVYYYFPLYYRWQQPR